MKLMVVGHAFLLAYAQKKFIAMKQLDSDLQIRLVIPKQIQDRFRTEKAEIHPSLAAHEVVTLGTRLAQIQGHMTYIHDPAKFARVVGEFQPDVIHVDEEPQALITVETIAIQRAVAKGSGITLFTWDNLLRARHFPMGMVKTGLRRYSLARASAVICGNRRAAEIVREERLFGGAIETLPQFGLDIEEHRPGTEMELRRSLGLDGVLVIGHAGRLVPEKGVLLLLEALARLQHFPWKLLMVGGGALEKRDSRRLDDEIPESNRTCANGSLRPSREISSMHGYFCTGFVRDPYLARTIWIVLGAGNVAWNCFGWI